MSTKLYIIYDVTDRCLFHMLQQQAPELHLSKDVVLVLNASGTDVTANELILIHGYLTHITHNRSKESNFPCVQKL